MNTYNSLHEREYEAEDVEQDREISLGTSTILGIFFGLALICSLFFGLGYSMGRKSSPPIAAVQENINNTPLTSSTAKPASGLPQTSEAPTSQPASAVPPVAASTATPATPTPRPAAPAPEKPTLTPVAANVGTASAIIVQIAAVSHREDADVLLSTLKQRGYDVFIRNEPQDKLLHVQVGPFPTRKDADTMRQRLLSDGYNAIIK